MTDKEKIRAEIKRRIEELQPCNTRENLRAHGAIAGYYQILSFINSMQEETVSIWHDASKKYPLTGKEIIVLRDDKIYYGKYIGGFHRYVRAEIQLTDDMAQTYAIIDNLTKKDKWIYAEDLQNLSNVEKTVKGCKEEPVSEELEEAANDAVISLVPSFGQKYSDGSYVSCIRDSFKREELIKLYKAGAERQKQQIMKEAITGQLENGEDYLRIKCLYTSCRPQDDGKLVKFIIINED